MDPIERKIRLIIVKDQTDIRSALEAFVSFDSGMECLGSFPDGQMAWNWLNSSNEAIDVALLDIDMPGINGIDLSRKIKKIQPDAQCLMCTIYDDSDKIFAALEAGASGYILKKSPPAKIIEAIHEIFQGGSPMTAEIARRVVQSFSAKKKPHWTEK